MRRLLVIGLCLFAVGIMVSPATAVPPNTFNDNQAKILFGHTFKEEYWTAPDVVYQAGNARASFAVSFAQYKTVKTFLVAFNNLTVDGKVGTLPYQLFGLRYYTPEGNEVLIGAVLAFLMAFNDTYNGTGPGTNGLPDPGNEGVYYVIPFGVGDALPNETYAPESIPTTVKKLGEGHFQFGQTYRNMYAKVIGANNPLEFLLSAALPIYIARFSELSITYDIKVDTAAGTVVAETFYTIGQVSKLWLWGNEVDPLGFQPQWGLCAAHYVVAFTSTYQVTGANSPVQLQTNITKAMDDDVAIRVGNNNERAFTIGRRGTYDIINETTGAKLAENKDAVGITLHTVGTDAALVWWQALFALDQFTTLSWAVSSHLQGKYNGPRALWNNARGNFTAGAVWYGTSFPNWTGHRIVHDPTYTAYADLDYVETQPEPPRRSPAFGAVVATVAIMVPALLALSRRRR
jgi:hypothetical protein